MLTCAPETVRMALMVRRTVLFAKAGKFKDYMFGPRPFKKRIIITYLASSSPTCKYWPSVVFLRTCHRSVLTVTTSGQYSPVWPSRSVGSKLLKLSSLFVLRNRNSLQMILWLNNESSRNKFGSIREKKHEDFTFITNNWHRSVIIRSSNNKYQEESNISAATHWIRM